MLILAGLMLLAHGMTPHLHSGESSGRLGLHSWASTEHHDLWEVLFAANLGAEHLEHYSPGPSIAPAVAPILAPAPGLALAGRLAALASEAQPGGFRPAEGFPPPAQCPPARWARRAQVNKGSPSAAA